MAGSALATLALGAGAIAIGSALRSGQPHGGQPTGRPSMSPAAASSPSQRSNPGRAQGHGQRDPQFTPQTLPAVTVGTAESQQITATGGTPPYIFSWSGDPPPRADPVLVGAYQRGPGHRGQLPVHDHGHRLLGYAQQRVTVLHACGGLYIRRVLGISRRNANMGFFRGLARSEALVRS